MPGHQPPPASADPGRHQPDRYPDRLVDRGDRCRRSGGGSGPAGVACQLRRRGHGHHLPPLPDRRLRGGRWGQRHRRGCADHQHGKSDGKLGLLHSIPRPYGAGTYASNQRCSKKPDKLSFCSEFSLFPEKQSLMDLDDLH